MRNEAGIGTCIEIETSTGCRGVIGPVPQPLCMRTVVSTDADKLIPNQPDVNSFFQETPDTSPTSHLTAPGHTRQRQDKKRPNIQRHLQTGKIWLQIHRQIFLIGGGLPMAVYTVTTAHGGIYINDCDFVNK